MSSSSSSSNLAAVKCIRFEHFGEPKNVLHIGKCNLGEWDGKSALVRWLASPINPVDLYIIKGQFSAYKPKLPAIAGAEAVGIVEKIGESATGIEVGDRVIRYKMPSNLCPLGGGLWTEYSFMAPETLLKIDPSIDLVSAATLAINPATAYTILKEFAPSSMKPGDCVLQNGANSGVGRAVIQLAKHFGYQTMNLIRKSGNEQEVADMLRSLGADLVFTQEEFADIIEGPNNLPKCKLGLNCVGGESAYLISKALEHNGSLVTYGEISGCESKCEHGIQERYFSIGTFCSEKKNDEKVKKMFGELQTMMAEGKLRPPPAEFRAMEEWKGAVEKAISHGTKQIFLLSGQEKVGGEATAYKTR